MPEPRMSLPASKLCLQKNRPRTGPHPRGDPDADGAAGPAERHARCGGAWVLTLTLRVPLFEGERLKQELPLEGERLSNNSALLRGRDADGAAGSAEWHARCGGAWILTLTLRAPLLEGERLKQERPFFGRLEQERPLERGRPTGLQAQLSGMRAAAVRSRPCSPFSLPP